jgi:hypothetical protein
MITHQGQIRLPAGVNNVSQTCRFLRISAVSFISGYGGAGRPLSMA